MNYLYFLRLIVNNGIYSIKKVEKTIVKQISKYLSKEAYLVILIFILFSNLHKIIVNTIALS